VNVGTGRPEGWPWGAPSCPAPKTAVPPGAAKVHITSVPSGGEISVDGKFFGNTPSDINLASGEHIVRVGGKEWTRTVQITGGEIQLQAELPASKPVAATIATAVPATISVQPVQSKQTSATTSAAVPQGWIGVTTKYFGSGGAVVTAFAAGSPAAKAGLTPGDVINAVNGISLGDEALDKKIAAYKPGSTVRLGYMRGAWAQEATVTVGSNAQ